MKHTKLTRMFCLLLTLGLLLALSACGQSEDKGDVIPESTGGRDIQKAVAADNIFSLNSNSNFSLNPSIATNHSNQLICSLVYENMVELDNNFEVIPRLITEWSCDEAGESWTFTVDTSHVFHDGSAVTPNDLRMSLEYCIHADRYAGRFASIKGISYSEDKLYVALGIGDKQFIKLLNIPVVKVGTNGDKHPMGSGPYMYNEEGTQLLAFNGYNGYDQLPVDTIDIKEYSTAEEIISAFEDSYIDVVVNDPSSNTNLGYASSNETRSFATTNMHYVAFNEESDICRYSNVRAALVYAFDRDYLANEMLHGNGVASAVAMYPTCAAYPSALDEALHFNLDNVKMILDNFGIKDSDGNGKLDNPNGIGDFRLTMIVCSESSSKAGMAQRFAQDMASIGITVDVQELSWDNYMKALEDGGIPTRDEKVTLPYDMYYAEVKLRNNFDLSELLQPRELDRDGEPKDRSNINYTHSNDQSYDNLIKTYLAAGDATRADAYYALAKHLSEDASIIPLGFERQEIITHRGVVKGVNPNAGNPLYDFQNWEIDLS